jgi:hypothetical protein
MRLHYFAQRDGATLNMVRRVFLWVIVQSLQAYRLVLFVGFPGTGHSQVSAPATLPVQESLHCRH